MKNQTALSRTMLARTMLVGALLLPAIPALAGPPLICDPVAIGNAKSLPWKEGRDWQGIVPSYDVSRLSQDTLALLTPAAPLPVRMETLRRAALYSSKEPGVADQLTSRLLARALDSEAAGKPDPIAWFDAGYFVETIRQATFVYRYDMLPKAERAAWKLRGDSPRLDGYGWVERAMRLGGKGMEHALSSMTEFRNADLAGK